MDTTILGMEKNIHDEINDFKHPDIIQIWKNISTHTRNAQKS